MIDIILLIMLIGLGTSYILELLILERKDSHVGPFQSKKRKVLFLSEIDNGGFTQAEHFQPVSLFDWCRRLFGIYHVKGPIWTVNDLRAERFTCPFCLSFWVSFPGTITLSIYMIAHEYEPTPFVGVCLFSHFAIAIISQITYEYLFGD
jgi:hypothetical protein